MKSLKNIAFVLSMFLSTVSASSIAVAAKNPQQANLAANNSKTAKKATTVVKKNVSKKVVKKPVKKNPLILVFGTDTCGRTTRMRQQLTTSKINYKYRNLDDPNIEKQMWDMLRRYEFKSNRVSLPVVYVKGHVFLNPGIQDVKSKM
ncbi:glutaredoxin [Sphaerospermopsis aphanizomenoides BCCUSP55]|uniref:glutaredoxin n=1 Tax=Sphaerospermopsis aphanizomenoides TaxID=459663 RepID=UPI001907FDA4|nr:glutaredoxin [Sphaerospermopsis aphanizomenoides]MBK1989772.1 glutaredoxin [Sphaerospermopsis aphanizomenoides BCCUSP55]